MYELAAREGLAQFQSALLRWIDTVDAQATINRMATVADPYALKVFQEAAQRVTGQPCEASYDVSDPTKINVFIPAKLDKISMTYHVDVPSGQLTLAFD